MLIHAANNLNIVEKSHPKNSENQQIVDIFLISSFVIANFFLILKLTTKFNFCIIVSIRFKIRCLYYNAIQCISIKKIASLS